MDGVRGWFCFEREVYFKSYCSVLRPSSHRVAVGVDRKSIIAILKCSLVGWDIISATFYI